MSEIDHLLTRFNVMKTDDQTRVRVAENRSIPSEEELLERFERLFH